MLIYVIKFIRNIMKGLFIEKICNFNIYKGDIICVVNYIKCGNVRCYLCKYKREG